MLYSPMKVASARVCTLHTKEEKRSAAAARDSRGRVKRCGEARRGHSVAYPGGISIGVRALSISLILYRYKSRSFLLLRPPEDAQQREEEGQRGGVDGDRLHDRRGRTGPQAGQDVWSQVQLSEGETGQLSPAASVRLHRAEDTRPRDTRERRVARVLSENR